MQAQAEIQRVAGRPPDFFRPPVGLTNPRIFRVTGELGLKIVGYTARGLDRRADAPEKIVGRLLGASARRDFFAARRRRAARTAARGGDVAVGQTGGGTLPMRAAG